MRVGMGRIADSHNVGVEHFKQSVRFYSIYIYI